MSENNRSEPTPIHAMWVWDARIILDDPSTLLQFSRSHEVNRLFLQISTTLSVDAYVAFVRTARRTNIDVVPTHGDPRWALSSGAHGLSSFLGWVIEYNSAVPVQQQFRLVNLDIEGHALPGWSGHESAVGQQWADNAARAYQIASASGLKLSVDVPFWINNIITSVDREPLGHWLASHASELVIMAYRGHVDGPDGVLAVAAPLLREAGHLRKSALVAVDTSAPSPHTSLNTVGQRAAQLALESIERALSSTPAFVGWAVNAYGPWSRMTGP